jgi:hypothetical protein
MPSSVGRIKLFTAMVPPLVGGGGMGSTGLFTAIVPPFVGGGGMGSTGLLSANPVAERDEKTISAARRKEKDFI